MKITDFTEFKPSWTFPEARKLISKCQTAALSFDYNLCMGGSVLNNGFSDNDLDIVAIPRSSKKLPDKQGLLDSFEILFNNKPVFLNESNQDPRYNPIEGREIYRFHTELGQRVDLILVVYS